MLSFKKLGVFDERLLHSVFLLMELFSTIHDPKLEHFTIKSREQYLKPQKIKITFILLKRVEIPSI